MNETSRFCSNCWAVIKENSQACPLCGCETSIERETAASGVPPKDIEGQEPEANAYTNEERHLQISGPALRMIILASLVALILLTYRASQVARQVASTRPNLSFGAPASKPADRTGKTNQDIQKPLKQGPIVLKDFVDTWVVVRGPSVFEPGQFRLRLWQEDKRIIGSTGLNGEARIELQSAGAGSLKGRVTVNNQDIPVQASLSSDKQDLTVVLSPPEENEEAAVFVARRE